MKKEYESYYLFRVWALSLFLGPVILFGISYLSTANFEYNPLILMGSAFLIFILSCILSLPALLTSFLVYVYINSKRVSKLFLKTIIAGVSIIGAFITFYFFLGKGTLMLSQDLILPCSYSAGIIISLLVCRIEEIEEQG